MPSVCKLISRNQLTMVFELKPNSFSPNNIAQAIGYVIAANSLFDIPGRPSPVGVLSDFMDQWYLIWVGTDGVLCFAGSEESNGVEKPLSRETAMYYIRKHLQRYNQLLNDEKSKKSQHINWAFHNLEAGVLKKQKLIEVEDNMCDLLETDEEIAMYNMNQRLKQTPLFQVSLPAEPFLTFHKNGLILHSI